MGRTALLCRVVPKIISEESDLAFRGRKENARLAVHAHEHGLFLGTVETVRDRIGFYGEQNVG